MSSPIHDVSDTAFWIAHHRALETARPDALFHDPFAALLAGERGRLISEGMPTSGYVAWSVALRTRIIDEYLAYALSQGLDAVLNLGAGLDTRPYRLTLPATLQWIEADYPHVIEYKSAKLAEHTPHCRLERVSIDLANQAERRRLLGRIGARAARSLVLTEGVVPYLANEEVATLAGELRTMRGARYWIVDYFSAFAQRFRARRRVSRAMQNAPFKFAPGDWFAFFAAHAWRPREVRYFFDEAQRFKRPVPLPWQWRMLMRLARPWTPRTGREAWQRSAGYALLEPATEDSAPNS